MRIGGEDASAAAQVFGEQRLPRRARDWAVPADVERGDLPPGRLRRSRTEPGSRAAPGLDASCGGGEGGHPGSSACRAAGQTSADTQEVQLLDKAGRGLAWSEFVFEQGCSHVEAERTRHQAITRQSECCCCCEG